MKKSLLMLAIISLLSCPVLAQDMDLFPELKGRFKPAETPKVESEVKAPETETTESIPSTDGYSEDEDDDIPTIPDSYQPEENSFHVPVKPTPYVAPETQPIRVNPDDFQGQIKEGNVKIQLTNLKGVLPYARNFSYCFADAVLTNQTNQTLQELHLVLNYQGSKNDLKFAGVPKKGEQVQQIMMNGPECESILSMPDVEIKTCKMEFQSESTCKSKIQFMPPNE